MYRPILLIGILFSLFSCKTNKVDEYEYIDLSKFSDGIHHWDLYSSIRSNERFDTIDIVGIANNLIAYQNNDGGWPKNIDWLTKLDPDSVLSGLSDRYKQSTFDNRNIFPQIEYLSAVYQQSRIEKIRYAAEKGFQYILNTENQMGGWRGWDANVITFNDDVMTGIMNLLLDVKQGNVYYNWLSEDLYARLMKAYSRGLSVILNCQVEINGEATVWCQQHDFDTYVPVQGRAYEHPSVTARESCDVVLFLMRINNPDQKVIDAIYSAVDWFDSAKITGFRYADIPIEARPYHETTIDFDREFVEDSTALPIWARYYDLEKGEPFLSLKDGTIVYRLSDISFDRRVGYEWYGVWPEQVFKVFSEWNKNMNDIM